LYEDILAMRSAPGDTITQVFKDALETHNRVRAAMRDGFKICGQKGAQVLPIDMSHLTTPEKRRSSFSVIKGDRD